MDTSIYLRTYRGDAAWLEYSLASILKFASGFKEVIVACPIEDQDVIFPILEAPDNPLLGVSFCDNNLRCYMGQQISKLVADRDTASDLIVFTDSDTIFNQPFTPETFLRNGKPILLVTPYETLGKAVPWQHPTEKALGFKCAYETMRRQPLVFTRDSIRRTREHIEELHQMPIAQYVFSQPGRMFSEFNAVGSYALEFDRSDYHVLDTTKDEIPPPICDQYWSWGGVTPEIKAKMAEVVR